MYRAEVTFTFLNFNLKTTSAEIKRRLIDRQNSGGGTSFYEAIASRGDVFGVKKMRLPPPL